MLLKITVMNSSMAAGKHFSTSRVFIFGFFDEDSCSFNFVGVSFVG